MADRLETASSGRARCRACGKTIDKGALRFGEEGAGYTEDARASVFWFHLRCAALRRPEKFVAAVSAEASPEVPDREDLVALAEAGVAQPRLTRLDGVERAPGGAARCRQCRTLIEKGTLRLRLSTFADTGFFDPLGFVHPGCGPGYFEVPALVDPLRARVPEVEDELLALVAAGPVAPPASQAPPSEAPSEGSGDT